MPIPFLPKIMVAPNGARRTKSDHPAVPVSVGETVEVAKACFHAGADGLHAHVRDADQQHVLDAGLYLELLSEMALQVPKMLVQITTEAVGRYTPEQQRQLSYQVKPQALSVSLKEMMADGDLHAARKFYHWAHEANISLQHILYNAEELTALFQLVIDGIIPQESLQMLFVLGRYSKGQTSSPSDLDPFIKILSTANHEVDWAVCAFGTAEIACLKAAALQGGKMRIGFENSIWRDDGTIATDNAAQIKQLRKAINA